MLETRPPRLDPAARRRFGRTELMVSPLGFGGAPIGLLETEQATVAEVLETLLDAGVNVIDTAAGYRGSEELIGRTLGHRRDEFVLVSKCGPTWGEGGVGDLEPWSPKLIARQIDRSLERLRTDRVDVMLLHSCELETLRAGDALATVLAAQEAGKVRFVGYSGDNATAADAATRPEISVIQTSISVCDQANIGRVLPAAEAHDVGVMAKRPLANAAWKARDQQYERYRDYADPYHDRFDAMGLRGWPEPKAWAERALRFTLSIPSVHVAIAGTTRRDNVLANLAATTRGPLDDAERDQLRAAFADADSGDWDGLQ